MSISFDTSNMHISKIQVKLLYSVHSTFDTSNIKPVNYTYIYFLTFDTFDMVSLKQLYSIENTCNTSDMYNSILTLIDLFLFCKGVWPSRLAGLLPSELKGMAL